MFSEEDKLKWLTVILTLEKILPLAPSSTMDNAKDTLAGEKNIFFTDVSFQSSL